MRKNRGIIMGMSNETIKKVIGNVSLKVFADEGNPADDGGNPTNDGGTTPTINYEDLIAKARKEEKDKQYNTIEKLKTQIDTLTGQHNADLLKIAGLEKDLQTSNEKLSKVDSGDSEQVKTLKETINTLTGERDELDKKVKDYESKKPVSREEVETEIRAELEAEYEVKTYKTTKLLELKDDILVPELVMWTTKEEIDNSIQSALERSAEIKKNLGISDDKKAQKRTPKSPANPSTSSVQEKEVSLERLATMDVRSPEYAELRRQLGLR